MHVTLVHVWVRPGQEEAFVEATRANHLASVKESGNRRFDLLQDPADPRHFILYEAYATDLDAAAHKETAHYLSWRKTVAEMMARPRQGIPMRGLLPEA